MKKTIQKIKEEHKELAQKLRLQKNLFKSKQREGSDTWQDLCAMKKMAHEFRHRHIARCLLRGRTYEQVEPKVRGGNEPDTDLIEKYKEEYTSRLNEEVCNEAV